MTVESDELLEQEKKRMEGVLQNAMDDFFVELLVEDVWDNKTNSLNDDEVIADFIGFLVERRQCYGTKSPRQKGGRHP